MSQKKLKFSHSKNSAKLGKTQKNLKLAKNLISLAQSLKNSSKNNASYENLKNALLQKKPEILNSQANSKISQETHEIPSSKADFQKNLQTRQNNEIQNRQANFQAQQKRENSGTQETSKNAQKNSKILASQKKFQIQQTPEISNSQADSKISQQTPKFSTFKAVFKILQKITKFPSLQADFQKNLQTRQTPEISSSQTNSKIPQETHEIPSSKADFQKNSQTRQNYEIQNRQANFKAQETPEIPSSQANSKVRQKNSLLSTTKKNLKLSLNFAEKSSKIWLFLAFFTILPVLFSHYFLQNYLYMRPCEQCVYIRFDMILASFGAFLGFVSSKKILKALAFVFAFYGCYLGLKHSFILEKIYALVKAENPFGGLAACKQTPVFPFDLPLHEYFGGLFMPSGECANDKAFVPKDAILSPLQAFFIGQAPYFDDGIYSKGWYLLPYFEFVNMPQACILIFCFALAIFLFLFMNFFLNLCKNKQKI